MVCSYRFPKGDGQPIPAVDRDDCHRQLDQLLFAELCADSLELFVRRMSLRDERNDFRPAQRCAFAFSIERSFAPRIEGIETLFTFAERTRVLEEL